jgi:hypothetical protein
MLTVKDRTHWMAPKSPESLKLLSVYIFFQFASSEKHNRNLPPAVKYIKEVFRKLYIYYPS